MTRITLKRRGDLPQRFRNSWWRPSDLLFNRDDAVASLITSIVVENWCSRAIRTATLYNTHNVAYISRDILGLALGNQKDSWFIVVLLLTDWMGGKTFHEKRTTLQRTFFETQSCMQMVCKRYVKILLICIGDGVELSVGPIWMRTPLKLMINSSGETTSNVIRCGISY